MDNEDAVTVVTPFWAQVGRLLQRAERLYLIVLRGAVLLLATILLLYAGWLVVSGLYQVSRSPASVKEAVAAVPATDLVTAQLAQPVEAAARDAVASPAEQRAYAASLNRYYALFRTRFEPFRQRDDKTLTKDEFDDSFLQVPARLRGVANGEIAFAQDIADLRSLIDTMTAAANDPKIIARLKAYRAARKVATRRTVQRTRTEYRRGWNRYSTACEGWFYEPIGCAERRAVEVPYSTVVTTSEFPKGTQSHIALFQALQDRYFAMLDERRQRARATADDQRAAIALGNVKGAMALDRSLLIAAAFLALMFFFLLIAIERHQRGLVTRLDRTPAPPPPPPVRRSRAKPAATG